MGRNCFLPILLLFLAAGCATPRPPAAPLPRPTWSYPRDAFITQRAVLSAHGRQFALNGYLASSETGGLRLIVTENFGGVLADVLVKPDGKVFIMRSGTVFRTAWIRRYVAADLQAIFSKNPPTEPALRMPGPDHFVIERRWYTLDLQVADIKPGPQSAGLFDETGAEKP